MIISHAHKYIFFAVPKTATHSIREALREHMGSDAWEQQMLFGRDEMPVPALAAIRHGHISVQQLRPHIPEEMWRDYFKFAFVRNPFDRFVSTFFFLSRNQDLGGQDVRSLMKSALRTPAFRSRILVAPQSAMLCDADGKIAMDYIARYEDIQASYDHVAERIGTPSKDLIQKNASEHESSSVYYDDAELRQMVTDFYAADFDLLGYDREPVTGSPSTPVHGATS